MSVAVQAHSADTAAAMTDAGSAAIMRKTAITGSMIFLPRIASSSFPEKKLNASRSPCNRQAKLNASGRIPDETDLLDMLVLKFMRDMPPLYGCRVGVMPLPTWVKKCNTLME
jgi:hypothetical protein